MLNLKKVLQHFDVNAKLVNIKQGPTVTRYNLELNGRTRLKDLEAVADDLAIYLKVKNVAVVPVPEKGIVGLEIPNGEQELVLASEIVQSDLFRNSSSKLTVPLGKDIVGNPVTIDLAKLPHLLIAGSTGSGKSCLLNTIIYGILNKAKADEVKLILIDPKMVEFTHYKGLPHFVNTRYINREKGLKLIDVSQPITTDVDAVKVLGELVKEVEYRYSILKEAKVNSIEEYQKAGYKMPYIVCIIDEVADLVMMNRNEVIDLICKLAQKARSAGVHLVLATQRPSVDIITGSIKANFPNRIAFQVATKIDSKVVLDTVGAEKLIGKGDLLFKSARTSNLTRIQGAYSTPKEVVALVDKVRECAVGKDEKELSKYIGVFENTERLFEKEVEFEEKFEKKVQHIDKVLSRCNTLLKVR